MGHRIHTGTVAKTLQGCDSTDFHINVGLRAKRMPSAVVRIDLNAYGCMWMRGCIWMQQGCMQINMDAYACIQIMFSA